MAELCFSKVEPNSCVGKCAVDITLLPNGVTSLTWLFSMPTNSCGGGSPLIQFTNVAASADDHDLCPAPVSAVPHYHEYILRVYLAHMNVS